MTGDTGPAIACYVSGPVPGRTGSIIVFARGSKHLSIAGCLATADACKNSSDSGNSICVLSPDIFPLFSTLIGRQTR